MKNIKMILAFLLALSMVLCMCACGNGKPEESESVSTDTSQTDSSETEPSETEPSETEPSETEPSETETTGSSETDPSVTEPSQSESTEAKEPLYTITVLDENGQPVSGVFVQLCRGDSCCAMGTTGDDGVANYYEDLVGEGGLTAKIIVVPEGKQCVGGVQQVELEAGQTNVVFNLEPSNYIYSISVVDADGNPFSGVFVQLCRGDTCCAMGQTGANGTAYYMEDLIGEGQLTAKIIVVPEGYTCVDGIQQIELNDGQVSVVFVLEAVAD